MKGHVLSLRDIFTWRHSEIHTDSYPPKKQHCTLSVKLYAYNTLTVLYMQCIYYFTQCIHVVKNCGHKTAKILPSFFFIICQALTVCSVSVCLFFKVENFLTWQMFDHNITRKSYISNNALLTTHSGLQY